LLSFETEWLYNLSIMSNVIDLLLETEQKAKDIVEAAAEKVRDVQQEADKKAEEIVKNARQEALTLQRESAEKTRLELEDEKKSVIVNLEEKQNSLLSEKTEVLDQAAEDVFKLLITPEYEKV
jgi:vacuolar-type H+-ATPase subunit E/Vma4